MLDCHTSQIAVKFAKILTKIDRSSSKEIEKERKFLNNGGYVKMILTKTTKPMIGVSFLILDVLLSDT